jgi:hypothetical protein
MRRKVSGMAVVERWMDRGDEDAAASQAVEDDLGSAADSEFTQAVPAGRVAEAGLKASGGTMKIIEQHGATEQHVWETGKALLASRQSAKHAAHRCQWPATSPSRLWVVELKHENQAK